MNNVTVERDKELALMRRDTILKLMRRRYIMKRSNKLLDILGHMWIPVGAAYFLTAGNLNAATLNFLTVLLWVALSFSLAAFIHDMRHASTFNKQSHELKKIVDEVVTSTSSPNDSVFLLESYQRTLHNANFKNRGTSLAGMLVETLKEDFKQGAAHSDCTGGHRSGCNHRINRATWGRFLADSQTTEPATL